MPDQEPSAPKRPLKKRIKYNLLYRFVLALIRIANIFPRKWVMHTTGFLGGLSFHLFSDARAITIENLTKIYGDIKSPAEIRSLAKEVFKMIGRNAGDFARGLFIDNLEELNKIVKVEGEEHLRNALEKGKGVIGITGHIGSFEFFGSYLGMAGFQPMIIGTALKDERLNKLLTDQREAYGNEVIARGKETLRLIKGLKSGKMALMLIDQDTKVKSRFIEFLGHQAATPIGPTLIARRTRASVVPMYITLQPDWTHLIRIGPEVDLEWTDDEEKDLLINTKKISDTTEEAILRDPAQWVWMHERWKTQPGEEIR